MVLITVIVSILLIIQVLLACYAWLTQRSLASTYNRPLTSMTDGASALEHYVRIYKSVNVKVNAAITRPARAHKDILYVHKKSMYDFDIFTTFWVLYALEYVGSRGLAYRRNTLLLQFLFFVFLVIGTISFFVNENIQEPMIGSAFAIQVVTIGFCFGVYLRERRAAKKIITIGQDLLDYDPDERHLAHQLGSDIATRVFLYPFSLIRTLIGFIIPL